MRGPGVSIMLSRGRDRNSDTFSPDDLHGSFRYAELSAVSSTRSCLHYPDKSIDLSIDNTQEKEDIFRINN